VRKATIVTILAALLFAGGGAGGRAQSGELIAFADTRVDWELVVRRLDGTGEHRVASGLANQLNPSLSPDGDQVAFESGGVGIEVARVDGGERRVLVSDGLDPSWSPDGRRIAWVSRRDGNADVYVSAADGTAVTRLTSDPADEVAPAWSPDSRRVVFSRDGAIHEVAADGKSPARQLVSTRFDRMTSPKWSPNGRALVLQAASGSIKSPAYVYLARPRAGEVVDPVRFAEGSDPDWSDDRRVLLVRRGDLWSLEDDGSGARHVLSLRPRRTRLSTLVGGWSEAGGRVAFGWDVGSRSQLYAVRPDGTGLRRLYEPAAVAPSFSPQGTRIAFFAVGPRRATLVVAAVAARRLAKLPVGANPSAPSWSPDGRRLAFETRDGVFTIRASGGRPTRLRGTTRADGEPAWSPDGRTVAFTRRIRGRPTVHVVDLRTGRVRLLRRDAESPAWSPDGRRIAYTNRYAPPYNVDVWVMRRDGSRPRRLTRHPEFDLEPVWSPDGARIAFTSTRGVDVAPWLGNARVFVMPADRGERGAIPVESIYGGAVGALSWVPRP
jgi:Tol biopolymer transport system component